MENELFVKPTAVDAFPMPVWKTSCSSRCAADQRQGHDEKMMLVRRPTSASGAFLRLPNNCNAFNGHEQKRNVLFVLIFFLLCNISFAQKLTSYVNPFIGTGGHGHTYPGATLPFGMVQLSPDNGTEGWDWCSGYNYSDSIISGFSHTHLNGTGIGDWCDISFMPLTAKPRNLLARTPIGFSHKNESASPGFYSVKLNNGIDARFTVTERAGFHEYDFNGQDRYLVVDLGFAINWDKATACRAAGAKFNRLEGYRYSTGWAKNQRVYFWAEFDQNVVSATYIQDSITLSNTDEAKGRQVKVLLYFGKSRKPLKVKVGLSSSGEEEAFRNLVEIDHWNFDRVRRDADARWEKELSRIRVQSPDRKFLETFYTALYHTCLAPNTDSEIGGGYKNQQGQYYRNSDGDTRYTIFSLWDTFRALNPLFTLTQPERAPEFIRSMLRFYDETGLLPVWDISTWEANTMTGYHAIPIIADAILKDIQGFDYNKAYTAMTKSAFQQQRGTPDYIRYKYLPQDKHGWSATITLEYAFDDWCIAQVAKKLGHAGDYQLFMQRAAFYKNIFDPQTGFVRAKKSDGSWVTPFDPYYSEHGFDGQYIEGTAWQHSFFVPHDVQGLAALYPAPKTLEEKLDSLFRVSSRMTGQNVSIDVTGLIGQYAHGNEPSHHIAYMYSFIGKPWKTQETARMIMDSLYNNTVAGLCGNDDCGQMSAWYVWSALGMYPANPASGEYVFGSPLIHAAEILLPERRKLRIRVLNNSPKNKYISLVRWNGRKMPATFITHEQIKNGGELVFLMSDRPNRTIPLPGNLPYSMSGGN
jgi:predicted alpha-1,2-mannosidase